MVDTIRDISKYFIKKILFFINHPLQKYRKTANTFVTCSGNYDGVGAQVHAVISTILFAELFNLEYVHTPFLKIEHNVAQNKDWEKRWELFFSLGYNEINIEHVKAENKVHLRHPLMIWKKKNVLYTVQNCHECTDLFVDKYNQIIESLKYKFSINQENKKISTAIKEIKQIALHIRRGDVKSSGINKKRFTDILVIKKVLDEIIHFCKNKSFQFQIHIFSQGTAEEYKVFHTYNVVFHLNENEYDTFFALVSADILIMAKSSFSYTAALLSNGFVFYDDFWHRPLNNWVSLTQKDSSVHYKKLELHFTT